MEKRSNIILLFCFSAFIAFFAFASWCVAPSQVLSDENRKIAELPKLSKKNLNSFPSAFEAYFNDRVFCRTQMVKLRNLVRYNCWRVSDAPNILVGKNDWLFFLGETGNILTAKEAPYTQEELDQWRSALSERSAYFKSRGIKYLFVVAPNKQSIYPEYFPLFSANHSRLDQLTDYLKAYPDVPFVNLKKPLLSKKAEGKSLYFKTDTHWNEFGAFIADQYLASVLSSTTPGIRPLAADGVRFAWESFNTGDCTKLMGLFGLINETVPVSELSKALVLKQKADDFRAQKKSINAPDVRLAKAVVFHDSFGDAIKPYLSKHFERVAYQLRKADLAVDLDLIEKEKPNVVIQEIVERHVVQLIPYSIYDWRFQLLDAVNEDKPIGADSKMASEEWLCVLPFTNEVNSTRLQEIFRAPHSNVKVTTCRQWTNAGVKIRFDPVSASYFKWYVLKSGAQEKHVGEAGKMSDFESEKSLKQLCQFVTDGKKYRPVKTVTLFDGSRLTLWKRLSN